MAYDPDLRNRQNILESKRTFVADDRQHAYESVVNALIKTGSFGVTVVGDVLTVRNKGFDATFILHEVRLDRDRIESDRD